MYGYFYPENNERYLESMSFPTAQEAIDWFQNRRSTWNQVEPQDKSEAAFLSPYDGTIVVVRSVTYESAL